MNSVSSVTIQQTSYLQIKPHLLPQQQLLDDSSIKLRADSNESTCTVDVPTVKQYFHKCRSTVSPHVYTDVSFYICLSAYLHITISWKKVVFSWAAHVCRLCHHVWAVISAEVVAGTHMFMGRTAGPTLNYLHQCVLSWQQGRYKGGPHLAGTYRTCLHLGRHALTSARNRVC